LDVDGDGVISEADLITFIINGLGGSSQTTGGTSGGTSTSN
jgi:hypothetical protein